MAVEQNGFLNIGDGAIKGNATVRGYEDQIVVQSVSYGSHKRANGKKANKLQDG
jgi:hypothetical protein